MSDTAQQVIFNAVGTVWLGVGAIIFMRRGLSQNASIRWFKQGMGWAMGDPFFVVGPPRSARRAQRLPRGPRPDAESERIGRAVWRRFRHALSWIFGSPVLGDGVAALRIAAGSVRPHWRSGPSAARAGHGTDGACGMGIPSRGRLVPRRTSCVATNSVS